MLSGNTRATKMKGPNQVLDRIKKGTHTFSNQIFFTLEKQTDEMVYELHRLTDDDIAIVEGKR